MSNKFKDKDEIRIAKGNSKNTGAILIANLVPGKTIVFEVAKQATPATRETLPTFDYKNTKQIFGFSDLEAIRICNYVAGEQYTFAATRNISGTKENFPHRNSSAPKDIEIISNVDTNGNLKFKFSVYDKGPQGQGKSVTIYLSLEEMTQITEALRNQFSNRASTLYYDSMVIEEAKPTNVRTLLAPKMAAGDYIEMNEGQFITITKVSFSRKNACVVYYY